MVFGYNYFFSTHVSFISRFLTYIASVMLMGKWCLLMLQVHKGSLVTTLYYILHQPCSICSSILEFHELTPSIALLIVVEQVSGKDHVLNHLSIPAACFTHPEISFVGLTEVSFFVFFCFYHRLTELSFIID